MYRVTDEALIAETAVWPNFFLKNIFSALQGFKLFIIISHDVAQMMIGDYVLFNGMYLVYFCARE